MQTFNISLWDEERKQLQVGYQRCGKSFMKLVLPNIEGVGDLSTSQDPFAWS